MRLNLGCGDRYAPGWHNVDHAGSPYLRDETVDLRGELPWTGVTHVYAGHLLEHLYVGQCLRLLRRLRDCMAPGGELMAVGPDLVLAAAMAAAGTLDVTIASLTDGGHRWVGDEHRWHCTGDDIEAMLAVTGWREIVSVGINAVEGLWPVADRRPQWQCAVKARR